MQALDIDGLLVPHDDEYLNEYTPPQFERLLWLTGFSGSAGAAIVMEATAILFIDGRYTGQARIETSADWFGYEDLRALPPWLGRRLRQGGARGHVGQRTPGRALHRLPRHARRPGLA